MVVAMNTLAIYEQFRAVLGEEKAKTFAETLGTMIDDAKNVATKEDIRLLRETSDINASRLDAALTKLAEAQVRTEARLDRLEQTVEKLAEAQVHTEARLNRLEQTVQKLVDVVEKLAIRSDRHEGALLELKFRDRLPSYLGRFLRKAKVIDASDLIDAIEPTVGSVAVDDFLRADVVATGTLDGNPTYLVGEISYTADEDDVMRAARRASCLAKAGLPAVGLVACESIGPRTAEYALKEGVRVWVDGRVLDAKSQPPSSDA